MQGTTLDLPIIWTDGKPGIVRRYKKWQRDARCYAEFCKALAIWRAPYVYIALGFFALYGAGAYFITYFPWTLAVFPLLYYITVGVMAGICKILVSIGETAMESGRYGRIMRAEWHEFQILDHHLRKHHYHLADLIRDSSTSPLLRDPIRQYLDNTGGPRIALRNNPNVTPSSPALHSLHRAAEVTALQITEAIRNAERRLAEM